MPTDDFFVTDAPGWYGDVTRVLHGPVTLERARRVVHPSPALCIRRGRKAAGEPFYRSSEALYPLVPREG